MNFISHHEYRGSDHIAKHRSKSEVRHAAINKELIVLSGWFILGSVLVQIVRSTASTRLLLSIRDTLRLCW